MMFRDPFCFFTENIRFIEVDMDSQCGLTALFVVILVSLVYSSVSGQDVVTDRAPNLNSIAEQTRTLSQTIQAIDDSHVPIGKEATNAYLKDGQDYEFHAAVSRLNKKSYYKTINLMALSKPQIGKYNNDSFQSNIILGLNRPYYKLKDEIRVIGNFDLRFDNILWGYPNSTTITVGYDLKKNLPKGASDLRLKIDYVAFKLGIPFH
jgi:hypothetical protein